MSTVPSDDERLTKIRKRLGRICEHGVEEWWVKEVAGTLLLRMACVEKHVTDEVPPAQALIHILREEVAALGDTPQAAILRIVLALDERYLGLSALERQEIAGREFRGDGPAVRASTIRKYHLPRAQHRLALRLLRREDEALGAIVTAG